MVSSIQLKWMVSIPFPLLFNSPHSKALDARNMGFPLSAKLIIIFSATSSHCPSGLHTWVPYHFFSDPGLGNDQCPQMNFRAYSVTLWAFAMQFSLFRRCPWSMSLYIDMKMIHPWKCSGSHFNSVISLGSRREFPMKWILKKFSHPNSTEITWFHKPSDLTFSSSNSFWTDASQT